MSKWGSLAGVDRPFRVYLRMEGGEPIRDKDGNPAYIDVLAVDGSKGRAYDREQRLALLEAAAKGGGSIPQVDPFEVNTAKCAAVTVDWYLVDPDTGESLGVPCSFEAAKELYSLPLTGWLFVQAWGAANRSQNFMTRSAKTS